MKNIIIVVLIMLALVLLFACKGESPANLSSETVCEETRMNMVAEHELWRKNRDVTIEKIEKELTENGWNSFEVNTTSEGVYAFMYDVVGHIDDRYNNPMTVCVLISFYDVAPEGKIHSVSYMSESGRVYESTEILPANDRQLYDYMHGG